MVVQSTTEPNDLTNFLKLNTEDIRKFLRVIWVPGEVYEIRGLTTGYNGRLSGYFLGENIEEATNYLQAWGRHDDCVGLYTCLNPVQPACLARADHVTLPKAKSSTSDVEVIRRRRLLLDFDAVTPVKGIPATDAERAEALERAAGCREWLTSLGWGTPLFASSGNGGALLYAIDLPNDDDSCRLVKGVTDACVMKFGADPTTFNASRISRIPGTINRKGSNCVGRAGIEDRPWRVANILSAPDELRVVTREQLEIVAAMSPTASASTASAKSSSSRSSTSSSSSIGENPEVTAWLEERCGVLRSCPSDHPNHQGSWCWWLEKCPWADDHTTGDGDACIWREADHSYSFHCFHGHCASRNIKDVYALGFPGAGERLEAEIKEMGLPTAEEYMARVRTKEKADETDDKSRQRPEIVVNGRQLRDVTADAMRAINAGNWPAKWFSFGGTVVRVGRGEATPLQADDIRFVLSEVADWFKVGKGGEQTATYPPDHVTANVLACPDQWLPPLRAIYSSPVFVGDTLLAKPGYDLASGLYMASDIAVTVPPTPTIDQIANARDTILDVLCDFPFVGEADKAHALALILLPFCRPLISGPTPVHIIDAPSEGTGKGLLAEVFGIITTGKDVTLTTEPRDDGEWSKVITSTLMSAPPYVLVDNVSRPVHSPALAAAVTARTYRDRVLGSSKMVELPVNATWIMTGNNIHGSREMTRRFIRIRLDARLETPSLRQNFKYPNLLAHVKAHRVELVAACLTLVHAWVAAGKPSGTQRIGSFESWADVMGGILSVASVPGLLGNLAEMMAEVNSSDGEYRGMVAAWAEVHGTTPITAGELLNTLDDAGILLSTLETARTDRGRVTKLGHILANLCGRVFGQHRLTRAGADRDKRTLYRLEVQQTDDEVKSAGPAGPATQGPAPLKPYKSYTYDKVRDLRDLSTLLEGEKNKTSYVSQPVRESGEEAKESRRSRTSTQDVTGKNVNGAGPFETRSRKVPEVPQELPQEMNAAAARIFAKHPSLRIIPLQPSQVDDDGKFISRIIDGRRLVGVRDTTDEVYYYFDASDWKKK